ncbi:MAG: ATP-dependent helicase, partial [Clostridium sp.]|nr:ATP-dependent helicase [Clostridium sp.]
MSLQFVMGGAGSGKTRYLYETAIKQAVEQPDRLFLFVVPEQYTMQTQKELVRLHPRKGLMNMDVLSFKRLAYRVFEDLGVQVPAVLDDMGKSMVLRKVAGMVRRDLGLYGSHLEQPGFISQLKSQISELGQYGIRPEDLKQVEAETDHPLLRDKLKDLGVIYKSFRDYIEDHYITAEEILDILCRELPRWEKLKNSVIYLDGYTGFTPVQYRLAELFMLHAREVVCTVTVDLRENPYEKCGIQHLFYMGRHTVCRLKELADRHHVEIKQEIRCDRRPSWRFKDSESLDFLEQNLYRYTGKVWAGKKPDIRLCQGKTPAEEAAYICTMVNRLVREDGLRYREIAVITGDPVSYGRELIHPFEEAGIPYFMDQKKSILENPMVELIRAALETVRDCSYESVFRYLKTGLVYDRETGNSEENEDTPVFSRENVSVLTDRLENYVRALGIRGWKKWDQEWTRPSRGGERLNLKELNQYRQWVLAPLKELREAFSQEGASISTVTSAVRSFLEKMELKEKLEEYAEFFEMRHCRGDENLAKEYGQVYERVEELLLRLEGLLGEEKADRKNYIQILEAGFEEIRVGVIPATADQVMIGDLTRSRLESVKVLFFAGLNEGLVPQRKSGGSLLTDTDREIFRSFDMELAPTAREDSCIQKFYL